MRQFFEDLKHRNVFRVGVAYAVVSWLIVQVTDIAFPRLGLPDWTITMILFVLLIGFPIALVLALAFELAPEGVTKTNDPEDDGSAVPRGGTC